YTWRDCGGEDPDLLKTENLKLRTDSCSGSSIPEIFWILIRIAEIIVDKHSRLAGKFEAFAAFVASDEVFQANHVGRCFREFAAVFFACAARQFLPLAADLPAHR